MGVVGEQGLSDQRRRDGVGVIHMNTEITRQTSMDGVGGEISGIEDNQSTRRNGDDHA